MPPRDDKKEHGWDCRSIARALVALGGNGFPVAQPWQDRHWTYTVPIRPQHTTPIDMRSQSNAQIEPSSDDGDYHVAAPREPLDEVAAIEDYAGLPESTRSLRRAAGNWLPRSWPADGDSRIALAACLKSAIIKIAGTWYWYPEEPEASAQDDGESPDPASKDFPDEFPGGCWQTLDDDTAKSSFSAGLAGIGARLNVHGSGKTVAPLWRAANELSWGRRGEGGPMLSWLLTHCEVIYSVRSSTLTTEELCAAYRHDNPDDTTTARGLAMRISLAIACAWPSQIKTKSLRYSGNILRGKRRHRGWIGISFLKIEPKC